MDSFFESLYAEISELVQSNFYQDEPNFQKNQFKTYNYTKYQENDYADYSRIRRINTHRIYSVHEWEVKGYYSNTDSYIYHYTSNANAVDILSQKRIRANTPKILNLGRAVFFTSHSPSKEDRFLIENNYIYYTGLNSKYNANVECAFAISRKDIRLKKVNNRDGRDVWKVEGDIDLNRTKFKLISRKNKLLLDCYLNQ